MKKNNIILIIFIGIFQLGFAQMSYYKSINSDLKYPYNMIISPDNRFCYEATDNHFQVYERNVSTGDLTLISTIEQTNDGTDIYWAYSMAISADSGFLYLGFREYIGVFEVNVATGLLTPTLTYQKWESPSNINNTNNCLVLSRDGQFMYNSVRDDIFLYSRDTITGQLELIEEYSDLNHVEGFSNEVSCALSPDNHFIYATGGHGISSFYRDPVTGLLTFMQEIRGSNYQNQSLTFAQESMVSFDNRFLYTITNSMGSGAAVVLVVDPLTDSLSIIQTHEFGYPNLRNPNSMTLSPNHKAFLVSSEGEIAFFEIDTISGHMKLINTFFSRSDFDNNMGGRKIYDQENYYLYSNPVFEDSIYIYRSNVFFSDHQSFCAGDSIKLFPFADYQTYLWSNGSVEPSITVTDSGQYVLQVTDRYSNQYIDTVFVSINPLPHFYLGNDTILAKGESILLTPGYGYSQYLWNIDAWTHPSLVFTNDSSITADSIQISVLVTDYYGCSNTDTILIRLEPTNVTELNNDIFSFSVSPNPASSMVSISSSLESDENIYIEIYSIQGVLLFSEKIKNNSKIDVSTLKSGTYILKLKHPKGNYITRLYHL
ncbi:MAG: T9SS type A sorting domain-containing protein [Bacteroidales bacterium]|nr:T9SS type A sorting domain-containing protein [Bacteroidales bacterium]